MDVRIGVTQSMREIELEVSDTTDRDALKKMVDAALANPEGVLWLEDKRGREVAVSASKIAYVEIGSPSERRAVGFTA